MRRIHTTKQQEMDLLVLCGMPKTQEPIDITPYNIVIFEVTDKVAEMYETILILTAPKQDYNTEDLA